MSCSVRCLPRLIWDKAEPAHMLSHIRWHEAQA